jgi:hypothetical protein
MMRSPILLCASVAGLTMFVAIGVGVVAAEQKSQSEEASGNDPELKQYTEPWETPNQVRVFTDAEVDIAQHRAVQVKQERKARRQLRVVYECAIRNASRISGSDHGMLWRMCSEVPDLR